MTQKERTDMDNQTVYMTVPKQYTMSLQAASQWSGIGINRLRDIVKEERCPFLLTVGRTKLVHILKFKQWLDERWAV